MSWFIRKLYRILKFFIPRLDVEPFITIYSTIGPKGIKLVETRGIKLLVDAGDTTMYPGLKWLGYEPIETELFLGLIDSNTTVIDIGANIGYYSLLAASRGCKVYAFEPSIETFSILESNKKLNRADNLTIELLGVSNKPGTSFFNYASNRSGGSSLSKENTGYLVNLTSIDEYFRDIELEGNIVVKIDIEGAEPWALEGMSNFLSKYPQVVLFIEYYPLMLRKMGNSPEAFLDTLRTRFKSIRRIDEKLKLVKTLSSDEYPKEFSNLICCNN